MSKIDLTDWIYDFKYNLLENFDVENKCDKYDMCVSELVSYEYSEYEEYCLNGKDIYDTQYCFIPLFYSKIKAKLVKEKMIKAHYDAIADSYADFGTWLQEQDNLKDTVVEKGLFDAK